MGLLVLHNDAICRPVLTAAHVYDAFSVKNITKKAPDYVLHVYKNVSMLSAVTYSLSLSLSLCFSLSDQSF